MNKGSKQPDGGDHALRTRLREQRERIERLRRQVERKDQEIAVLRAMADRTPKGPPDSLAQSPPVFFLVGRAKSGTSWLMRTLDAHPEILCRGEGRIFGREYKSEDIKNMPSRTIQPSSLYRAILDAEYLNAWIERSVWTRDQDKEGHLKDLTRVAAEHFLAEKLSKTGKRIVGDKTPFLGDGILEEIGEIYPEAKVVHIIRDGRDVAVSSIHHTWNHAKQEGGTYGLRSEELDKRDRYRADPQAFLASGESIFAEGQLAEIAKDWTRVVSRARKDGPRFLGERYSEVRYEDLLERPEGEVRRLLGFLGADAGEQTVQLCVESASFENWARGRGRGEEDSQAFLRKGIAGDWRNVFTEGDRLMFEEVAGDLLVELGYEKGND